MQGKSAVREQFVRPFITAFPGNRHFVKNIIFGRDVAVIEFTFKAEHKGPFDGRAATDARIELPGCGVYEYDSARRQITAARICRRLRQRKRCGSKSRDNGFDERLGFDDRHLFVVVNLSSTCHRSVIEVCR
jgi:hypothetical protein